MINIIGIPPHTKLLRIDRVNAGWRLWTATNDFKLGSYLLIMDGGDAFNVTERVDEGPDSFMIRPCDSDGA